MDILLLGISFFLVAMFYASVGFGGGSSYLALLVLWGVSYSAIPIIALICNIVVVSGNSFHYIRAGYLNWRLILPATIASVPMAYLGGRIAVDKEIFLILLFMTLLAAGLRMLLNNHRYAEEREAYRALPIWVGILLGAVLGLLSGIVGIGGGIFLAPILYNMYAGSPKQIATASSLFILVNSIAGLLGQVHKYGDASIILEYWYLPLLVFIGGQLGSLLTTKVIPARLVAILTSILVLFVAGRLGTMIVS